MSLLLAGLVAGCGSGERDTNSTARTSEVFRTNTVEDATIRQGERAKDGGLVIHVFDGPRGLRLPVRVHDQYGFMVHNVGDMERPQARFELALNRENRVVTGSTMEEFQKALDALPRGSTLSRYDKCSASTAYGLDPAKLFEDIRSYCSDKGITVTNAEMVTCTCDLVKN